MRLVNKSRSLLATAAFIVSAAIALLAAPNAALADTVTIDQSSFGSVGGHLELSSSCDRTYVLTENVTGSIDLFATDDHVDLVLDLNGHTLTCPASSDRLAISYIIPSFPADKVTIKNGAVVQNSAKSAIRTEHSGYYGQETILEDLDVTAVNQPCVTQCGSAPVNVIGGSYTTMNEGDNNASVFVNQGGSFNVSGGTRITLKGGDNILSTNYAQALYTKGFFLKDCSLSQAPGVTGIFTDSSQCFYKAKGDEYWQIVPNNDELKSGDNCNYYTSRDVRWGFWNLTRYFYFFEDEAEGRAFVDANPNTFNGRFYSMIYTFTFNPDNGEEPVKLENIHWGTVISKDSFHDGADPVNGAYIFKGWKNGGGDYDFSSKVTDDTTLTASWQAPAATVNGKSYVTIEEAIDAASSGDTVILFRDLTRTDRLNIKDKSGISIDLNGKTITYSGSGAAIVVQDSSVTLTDSSADKAGKVSGATGCVQLNSGMLEVKGGTYESETSAVTVPGGALTVSGGTFSSSSVEYDIRLAGGTAEVSGGYVKGYVYAGSDGDLSVKGGSFGTDGNKASVRDGYHMLRGDDGRYSVAAHTWSDTVEYNGNGTHSRHCTADGCSATETSQCWGTLATCEQGRVCYTCKATYTDPDPSNHVAAAEKWSNNTAEHWHECTACGEPYTGTEEMHDFVWVTDVEPTTTQDGREHEQCSVCRYDRDGSSRAIPKLSGDAPVISGISDGVSYDGTTTFEVTDPDGDLKSVTAGGEELAPGKDGKYTLPYGEGIQVVATDKNDNSTKVTVSSYAGHNWTEWTSLGGTHERHCTHSGCAKVGKGDCSGGKATCSAKATCTVCGGSYGELDPGNHVGAAEEWTADSTEHWRKCTGCGEPIGAKEAHDLAWTIDKDATTTEEGLEHEECIWCEHQTGRKHVIPMLQGEAPEVSGISDGMAYDGVTTFEVTDPDDDLKSVTVDGSVVEPGEDGKYTLPYGGDIEVIATDQKGNTTELMVTCYEDHDWGEWTSLGGTHERQCKHSGCAKVESGNCSGGTATCSAKAACEVCGGAYGELDPGNHVHLGNWEHDDSAHWRTCADCGTAVDKAEHELQDRSDSSYTWRECATCGFVTDKAEKPDADPDKGDKDDKGDKGDKDDKGGQGDKGGQDNQGSESGSGDTGSDSGEDSTADEAPAIPATGDPFTYSLVLGLGIAAAGAAATTTVARRRH